jgi:hypothetical protein
MFLRNCAELANVRIFTVGGLAPALPLQHENSQPDPLPTRVRCDLTQAHAPCAALSHEKDKSVVFGVAFPSQI